MKEKILDFLEGYLDYLYSSLFDEADEEHISILKNDIEMTQYLFEFVYQNMN